MKKTILLLCFVFSMNFLNAQALLTSFPTMAVTKIDENDNEVNLVLPRSNKKPTVIVVIRPSSKDSECIKTLQDWQPFLNNLFRAKTDEKALGLFSDEGGYEGEVYYIALVPGASENTLLNKMRENVKPEDRYNMGVYQVSKSRLDVDKDQLKVYLLHVEGTIVAKESGEYTQKKFLNIEEKLQEIRDNTK